MSRLSRKTPLTAKTTLKRGPGLKRGGRLRRTVGPPPDAETVAAMAAFHALAEAKGARCAVCGHRRRADLEVHHVIPQETLRKRAPSLLWDPANGLVLCDEPAPVRCHTRHTLAVRRVPRDRLRPENLEFAEALGLGWYIERHYPTEGR